MSKKSEQKTPLYIGVNRETRKRWNELCEFARFRPDDFLNYLMDLYEIPANTVRNPPPPAEKKVEGRPTKPVLEKLWAKVDKGGPVVEGAPHLGQCWLWTGGKNEKGHGIIVENGKNRRVHRVVWESVNGPIPPDQLILQRCRRKVCVRPEHLVSVDKVTVTREALKNSYNTWSNG